MTHACLLAKNKGTAVARRKLRNRVYAPDTLTAPDTIGRVFVRSSVDMLPSVEHRTYFAASTHQRDRQGHDRRCRSKCKTCYAAGCILTQRLQSAYRTRERANRMSRRPWRRPELAAASISSLLCPQCTITLPAGQKMTAVPRGNL